DETRDPGGDQQERDPEEGDGRSMTRGAAFLSGAHGWQERDDERTHEKRKRSGRRESAKQRTPCVAPGSSEMKHPERDRDHRAGDPTRSGGRRGRNDREGEPRRYPRGTRDANGCGRT